MKQGQTVQSCEVIDKKGRDEQTKIQREKYIDNWTNACTDRKTDIQVRERKCAI